MLDINPLNDLRNLYCALRVYRRNQSRRRFYYRKIKQEKLRLVEAGVCPECLRLYCRYLATGKIWRDIKACAYCRDSVKQLAFDFSSI
jgi:hypothetical protein